MLRHSMSVNNLNLLLNLCITCIADFFGIFRRSVRMEIVMNQTRSFLGYVMAIMLLLKNPRFFYFNLLLHDCMSLETHVNFLVKSKLC